MLHAKGVVTVSKPGVSILKIVCHASILFLLAVTGVQARIQRSAAMDGRNQYSGAGFSVSSWGPATRPPGGREIATLDFIPSTTPGTVGTLALTLGALFMATYRRNPHNKE